MFGIDFPELIVIGAVALIVIGPKDLPKVARTAGLLMGRVRRYVSDVKSEISKEMELSDLKQVKDQFQESAREFQNSINDQARTIQSQFEQSVRPPESENTGESTTQSLPDVTAPEANAPQLTPPVEALHVPSPALMETIEMPLAHAGSASEHNENQLDLFGEPLSHPTSQERRS